MEIKKRHSKTLQPNSPHHYPYSATLAQTKVSSQLQLTLQDSQIQEKKTNAFDNQPAYQLKVGQFLLNLHNKFCQSQLDPEDEFLQKDSIHSVQLPKEKESLSTLPSYALLPIPANPDILKQIKDKMKEINKQNKFKKYFENSNNLHQLKIIDNNFKNQLLNVDQDLQKYFNFLLQDKTQEVEMHVDKQLYKISKNQIFVKQKQIKGKALFKKITEDKVLSVIKTNNIIKQTQKKEILNFKFLSQIILFKDVLQDIFQNENFGQAITKEANLYLNIALQNQQKAKQKENEQSFDSITNNLNRTFQKHMFYKLAKQGKLAIKNQQEVDKIKPIKIQTQYSFKNIKLFLSQNAETNKISQEDQSLVYQIILQFFEACDADRLTPKPVFVEQARANNVLKLVQMRISDSVAKAIAEFLVAGKDVKQCQVKSLVIDECSMSDENFACILKGCIRQGNFLQSIIYQQNYFDEKSAEQIKILIPNLVKFSFSNPKNTFLKNDLLRDIIDCIIQNAKFLNKLKLSKLQIRDQKLFENIFEFVQASSLLQELDLSWTSLQPKQLAMISQAILNNPYKLRKLNLSYNTLRYGSQEDQILSNKFLNNLEQYFKLSTAINHIDFSGMNLNGKALFQLAKQLVLHPFLSVIHLNDNNIMNGDKIYINELLDIFGTEIIKERNEIDKKLINNPILKNPEVIKSKVFSFLNHDESLQNNYMTFSENDLNLKKQKKDLLFKTLTINNIKNDLMVNQREGCGRGAVGPTNENFQDYLTLSRKVNMPELIFNLGVQSDEYFEANFVNNWQASFNSECFICDYHRLVVIMYDQGNELNNNPELMEIKDQEFLKMVQVHCNEQFRPYDIADVPVILGTVVQQSGLKNIKIAPYQRKIKMLRAEFFSLLACSQAAQFTKKSKIGSKIKKAVIAFTENRQLIRQSIIRNLLRGWEHNLINYVKENQVHDVFSVNFPEYLNMKYELRKLNPLQYVQETFPLNEIEEIEPVKSRKWNLERLQKQNEKLNILVTNDNLFCCATYVPPGYHHFLIYDHATQRVFIKEIIVPLRNFPYIYPDQIQNNYLAKPPRVNVWRLWTLDTQETEVLVYTSDLTSGLYEPQLLIKDQELLEQVKEFQKNRRSDYKIFYRELVARSLNYPKISFPVIYRILQYFMDKAEIDLPRAFIELSFQKTIRKQNVKLLKGDLCRAELMDFIIRIVERLDSKDILTALIDFTDNHIKPIADFSEIPKHRKLIRSSGRTNDLLHKNKIFLQEIFDSYKEGFTRQAAVSLICTDLQNNLVPLMPAEDCVIWMPDQPPQTYSPPVDLLDSLLPTDAVLRYFSYSLMTVINEQTDYKKYNYCYYVEFLEFICRVAINLYSNFKQKSIYEKTKDLLEILLIRNNFIKQRDHVPKKVEGKKKQEKKEEESYQIIEPSDDSDLN